MEPDSRHRKPTRALWQRIAILVLLAFLTVRAPIAPAETSYASLLSAMLAPAPDPVFGTAEHEYAMTYGLVLSAAVVAGDRPTARTASDWLIADRQPKGWGTPWAWDPFGDGTTNPANTAYAITTALAVDALLDGRRFTAADAAVLVHWARSAWSDGFYWYSELSRDATYTPNVSAMLAGVTARALAEHPDLFGAADAELLSERVRESFARLSDDALAWPYSALQLIPNDLSHQVYIVWGGERFRDVGGHPAWSRSDAFASLDRYWDGDSLMPYPVGGSLTRAMQQRTNSPWMVSGSGMALAFVATWGHRGLERWRRAAVSAASTITAPPRFTAHALLGLALVERLERTTLR